MEHWSGTGTQTTFPITFPYLDKDHIVVAVDEGSGFVTKSRPTDWDFTGGSATPSLLTFASAPPSGTDNVRIQRQTDHSALAVNLEKKKFLRSTDVATLFNQQRYYTEEVEDLATG